MYNDNEAELNVYDVAKEVYEPVKDNEKTEEKNYVCHIVFICLYYDVMMFIDLFV